ncbi:hypothetical protein RND71_020219 [Anisodus tanguticus]|uniref:XPG-I domain-containing protein n=1 Tax=Anisodus tanguticus TaxID=243964 RepID=A0AAE1VA55_9SOLA|nr:hypothetical protein RND71_020219 [Anisodus tanguticus]
MHRVNLLHHYGVKPILVFDGGPLPMKNEHENKRGRSRKENLSRAIEPETNGNMTAAYECYQKAVDISPSMVHDLIQVLKRENVCYVVAPYEADAQMTFLAISKQVDAVITEDSDLIAFGCPRIIYKMDKFGQGVEFRYSKLDQNKELNLTGFTKQMLLEMCILSGCDYLQSLPGMGLKKAHPLMKKFKSYDEAIKHLRYNTAAVSPMRTLIPTEVAQGIANDDIDPFTMMPFQCNFKTLLYQTQCKIPDSLQNYSWTLQRYTSYQVYTSLSCSITIHQKECNAAELVHSRTYELNDLKVEGERRKLDLPAQKNLLTNYFCTASLEANQKFRVPRASPILPNTKVGVSSPWADSKKGADSYKFESLSMSSPDPLGVSSALVDDDILLKASTCLESKSQGLLEEEEIANGLVLQPVPLQHPICKPCITLSKEHALDLSESKTRAAKQKMTVRSSYFLKKNKKEDIQDDKSETNEAANDKSRSSIQENDCVSMSDARNGAVIAAVKNAIPRSSYFQYKPSAGNEREREKKRVIVRSPYFQKNLANENSQGNSDVAELEHSNPKASSENDYSERRLKKRKVTFIDTVQTENTSADSLEAETSGNQGETLEHLSVSGDFNSDLDDSIKETKDGEGKFASGLLAPLKDIKNTSTNRSASNIDLSKFVYKPTKLKQLSARRKVNGHFLAKCTVSLCFSFFKVTKTVSVSSIQDQL